MKSKYGATIQTAVDYVMAIDPKGEDLYEILPHVAAVAAAYGDPKGKYEAFMKNNMATYQSKPFWFYDQTAALSNSPAARMEKRSTTWAREDAEPLNPNTINPFQCPEVVASVYAYELDNGVFTNCLELQAAFEAPVPHNV